MILGPRVMNFPKKTYVTVEDLNAAVAEEAAARLAADTEEATARTSGDASTLLSAKTFTTESLQTELPKYTKLGVVAPDFSASDTYEVGEAVIYQGNRYVCSAAVSTAGEWNPSNWTQENVQTAIENSSSITIRVYDED